MRICRTLVFCLTAGFLASCDPGVHFAWEKDFDQPIDATCVQSALRTVVPDVTRTTWVDVQKAARGFPRGTEVTQFNYSDPSFIGGYQLNIARLPNGKTHYDNEWGKLGTDIPSDEISKILPLLNRANNAVAKMCNLSFEGAEPKQG